MGYYKIRRFFLSLLVVFVLFSVCSKCYATTDTVSLEDELIELQRQRQDDFIILSLYPYMNNTEAWQNTLKPFFDDVHANDYCINFSNPSATAGSNNKYYSIYCYSYNNANGTSTATYQSLNFPNLTATMSVLSYDTKRYYVTYIPSTNSFSSSISYPTTDVPRIVAQYKSPLWYDFMKLIYSEYVDYNEILVDIRDYLAHIDIQVSVDRYGYILSQIYSVCAQISQNTSSYTQQIDDIQDTLDDINDELTSINSYLNNTTLDPTTITDDLPSNSSITSPTDSILTDIFTQYQNAFTSTNYVDIVFPLGFINDTITIPSDYTETFFPPVLVTLIQLCYWYVISRWIILSLIKVVNSMRNLDFMEKTNEADPKTELL